MSSKLEIWNSAIGLAGISEVIESVTEDSTERRACSRFWPGVLDAVLRGHPWNCAIQRKTLTALSDSPIADYDHQYQMPASPWCLRVLQVGSDNLQPVRWRPEGRLILTDEVSPKIVYIKRITDTAEFDPLLVDVLELKLALKVARPLSKDRRIAIDLIKEVQEISLPEARSIDAQEGSVQEMQTDSWNNSRF